MILLQQKNPCKQCKNLLRMKGWSMNAFCRWNIVQYNSLKIFCEILKHASYHMTSQRNYCSCLWDVLFIARLVFWTLCDLNCHFLSSHSLRISQETQRNFMKKTVHVSNIAILFLKSDTKLCQYAIAQISESCSDDFSTNYFWQSMVVFGYRLLMTGSVFYDISSHNFYKDFAGGNRPQECQWDEFSPKDENSYRYL